MDPPGRREHETAIILIPHPVSGEAAAPLASQSGGLEKRTIHVLRIPDIPFAPDTRVDSGATRGDFPQRAACSLPNLSVSVTRKEPQE